jgi:hypothetical protein
MSIYQRRGNTLGYFCIGLTAAVVVAAVSARFFVARDTTIDRMRVAFAAAEVNADGGVLDKEMARASADGALLWYDARELTIEGMGWDSTGSPFARLPAAAFGVVPDAVWDLSHDSAGICVRFVTEAREIHARWTLTREKLAEPHMPASSVSGLDLYVKSDHGKWRWLAIGLPSSFPDNEFQLVEELPAGQREFKLYLPLYNGVVKLDVGIPSDSTIARVAPCAANLQKPIVFYGTSITQGGNASRTGMAHVAIVGRRLNRPVINLGFAGNGRMEIELAELLASVDAAAYVLDCLPNLQPHEVADRTEPFVRRLRESRPATPIVLVEGRTYGNAHLIEWSREHNRQNRAALSSAYEALIADGVSNLHYLRGDELLGDDFEATVDGSHLSDLGFMRQADAFCRVFTQIFSPPGD